jgi:phenylalanyl-tRNA synthetase alpha subunit
MSEILAPVSFGELLDKVTILQIKSERMTDAAKVANVRKELMALERIWNEHPASNINVDHLMKRLKEVNERLWVIEDDIRILEKQQRFDDEFVQLARSVYFENDDRAKIKKEINLALGSAYVEEKSYQDYRTS